jgi:hypothetical protein
MKMYSKIKSVEIFPTDAGVFEYMPRKLLDKVYPYIKEDKATIRIYADLATLKDIYNLCDKYNVRCQKYIV